MEEKRNMDFCVECRKETAYDLIRREHTRRIRGKEYTFPITAAVCSVCGQEMSLPGLLDLNIKEFDDRYRAEEGIIAAEEMEALLNLYHTGEAPLSLAPGFGEGTIARYLDGQVPSKEHSDAMKAALKARAERAE